MVYKLIGKLSDIKQLVILCQICTTASNLTAPLQTDAKKTKQIIKMRDNPLTDTEILTVAMQDFSIALCYNMHRLLFNMHLK